MRPNAHTAAMTSVTKGRQLHCLPSGPQSACRLSQNIPFRQAACTQPLPQQRRCLAGHARCRMRNAANPFDLAWGTSLNVDAQVMHLLFMAGDMPQYPDRLVHAYLRCHATTA